MPFINNEEFFCFYILLSFCERDLEIIICLNFERLHVPVNLVVLRLQYQQNF